MNIAPSVGRRVWYWPSIEEAAYWNKEQTHPCQADVGTTITSSQRKPSHDVGFGEA